jgi:hypothetical protein
VVGDGSSDAEDVREAGLVLDGRDLGTGSDGSGPVGGAMEGREGRGNVVVDMVLVLRLVVDDAVVGPLEERRRSQTLEAGALRR